MRQLILWLVCISVISISCKKENIIDNYLYNPKTEPLLKNWLAAQKIIISKKELLWYVDSLPDDLYKSIEPIGTITKEMLVNTNFTIHFGMYYDNYIEKIVFKKANNPETWEEFYSI